VICPSLAEAEEEAVQVGDVAAELEQSCELLQDQTQGPPRRHTQRQRAENDRNSYQTHDYM